MKKFKITVQYGGTEKAEFMYSRDIHTLMEFLLLIKSDFWTDVKSIKIDEEK